MSIAISPKDNPNLSINKLPEPGLRTYSTAENFIAPTLLYDSKTNDYRLVQDYTFEWGTVGARKRLTQKAGFEYDKASVPRLLQGLARSDGPWDGASLFHDDLYLHKGKFTDDFYFETQNLLTKEWQKDSSPWKRGQADDLLEYMGKLGGASKGTALLYKTAVRIYPPNWFKGF